MQHLESLLGTSAELNPVTLELANYQMSSKRLVRLRFRKQDEMATQDGLSPMIEIKLDDSSFEGLATRVAIDSHLLLKALRIGFRTFRMQSPCLSVFSCDGRNKHVLAAMHDSLTVCPASNMQVISTAKAHIAA